MCADGDISRDEYRQKKTKDKKKTLEIRKRSFKF
jgi:hypothetical protein